MVGINDVFNMNKSFGSTDEQGTTFGENGDAYEDLTFLKPTLFESNLKIDVIPPILDYKGLNIGRKESNLIINSQPPDVIILPELNES